MYIEQNAQKIYEQLTGYFTSSKTIHDSLGIVLTHIALDKVMATMPVDNRCMQPFGLLHGGASVVLAESTASIGACLNIDPQKSIGVGQEINANHVRSVVSGEVTATACPIHIGASSQIWGINICDEQGRLVCISRCTMAVREKR